MLPEISDIGQLLQKVVHTILVAVQHNIKRRHEELLHASKLNVIGQILQHLR